MLTAKDDAFHREHNKLIEIDDIYARELNGKRVMDKSHAWQCWEDMFAIKQAIETSGYKTRKDVEGVIQALEGMQMKNSIGHPQGDKLLRKEDHVGIIDCYISHVENGRLEVKKNIPKEELVKHMPVRFNLRPCQPNGVTVVLLAKSRMRPLRGMLPAIMFRLCVTRKLAAHVRFGSEADAA